MLEKQAETRDPVSPLRKDGSAPPPWKALGLFLADFKGSCRLAGSGEERRRRRVPRNESESVPSALTIPCGQFVSKNKEQDKKLDMLPQQPEDPERCESMELDSKIRDLIERSASLDPKGVSPEATRSHRNPSPPKTPRKTTLVAHPAQGTAGMSAAHSLAEPAECAQSSRRKNLTDPLEQKIRCLEKQRKELLEVNQQWDQQFRSMRELYERKVAELRSKLRAAEGALGALECERRQSQSAGGAARDPRRKEERETLNEELQELKKENKFLKEKTALALKNREHYELEIQRLNKALQDVLKTQSAPPSEDCCGQRAEEPSHAAMRTEVEVLRQQVQIYEEDFRKERSDRERLGREKEELRRLHRASQAQLARLSSQIKACQMEKEKLEKQLEQCTRGFVSQMRFPACDFGSAFQQWDPWVPAGPGAVRDRRERPQDRPRHTRDTLPPEEPPKGEAVTSVKKAHE